MSDKPASSAKGGSRPLLHGVEWAVEAGLADEVMRGTMQRVRRRRRRKAAVAGVVAALLLVTTAWWWSFGRPAPSLDQLPHGAVVIVPTTRTLPDGSRVDLKAGAEIAVDFDGPYRRVVLRRGEAHFEVAKNPAQPFIVTASGVDFRAVGTAFSVEIGAKAVELLVTEGRVSIEKASATPPPTGVSTSLKPESPTLALVDAGNRATVELARLDRQNSPVTPEAISAQDMNRQLAWRTPQLEFTRTALAEALTLINQHSRTRLLIGDSSLGEVRISGMLRGDNVEPLLHLLEGEYGILAERQADGSIVLRPKS